MMTVYTPADIAAAADLYAAFHGIDPAAVDVSRNYEGDEVIGFRLSRDANGSQTGDDERYGQWP